MTHAQRVKFWDMLNLCAMLCGGDPAKNVYGNIRRQQAVIEIESLIREFEAQKKNETPGHR